MEIVLVLFISLGAISLFILGFYTGFWLRGRNTKYIEVPKVEIVKVPEPMVVKAPPAAPPVKPKEDPVGPVAFSRDRRTSAMRQEAERLSTLLDGDMPEA